jgi:hypothetical protein
VAAIDAAVRSSLAPDAAAAMKIAVEPSMGGRAVAAVCVRPRALDGVFPAEDARALEVPAYLRRRAAAAMPLWDLARNAEAA